jgi:hypothetical protein
MVIACVSLKLETDSFHLKLPLQDIVLVMETINDPEFLAETLKQMKPSEIAAAMERMPPVVVAAGTPHTTQFGLRFHVCLVLRMFHVCKLPTPHC